MAGNLSRLALFLHVAGRPLWARCLIANGYRALAYILLIVFVLPLLTVRAGGFGVTNQHRWRLHNPAYPSPSSRLPQRGGLAAPPANFDQRVEELRRASGLPGWPSRLSRRQTVLAKGCGVGRSAAPSRSTPTPFS
jgi:hypothetical protein